MGCAVSGCDNVATKADIQRLEARIDLMARRLLIRLGSMIAAATGIPIAIHYIR